MSYVSYQQPSMYAPQYNGYNNPSQFQQQAGGYAPQYQQQQPGYVQQQYQQPAVQQHHQQYQQPAVQQQYQQPAVHQQAPAKPVQAQAPAPSQQQPSSFVSSNKLPGKSDLKEHQEIKAPSSSEYIVSATPISPSNVPHAELTAEEQQSLQEMKKCVQAEPEFKEFVTEQMMIEFLMARKFEPERALVLLRSHMAWRRENGILNRDNLRLDPIIISEIQSAKLLTDTSSRDAEGAQIVYFRPSLMSAKQTANTTTQDFCRAVFFLLQRCIADPTTQRQGFLFICDLRGTSMTSVDYRLIKAVINMLQNRFPGRLKRVLLLEPPRFFKMAFKMIKPLIAEKYLQKMSIVTLPEILEHAPAANLFKEYGGELEYDHSKFLELVKAEEQSKKSHGEAINPHMSVTGVPLA